MTTTTTTAQEFTQTRFYSDKPVASGIYDLMNEIQDAGYGDHRGYKADPTRMLHDWAGKLACILDNLTANTRLFVDTHGMVYADTGFFNLDPRTVAFGPRGTSIPLDIHMTDDLVKDRILVTGVCGWTYLV